MHRKATSPSLQVAPAASTPHRLYAGDGCVIEIQDYAADKARQIAELFHQSVHAIDPSLYTPEQQEAWAPTPIDYELWFARLSEKNPFIALIESTVAGFIELDADGHIDCTYTHPHFQGRGVASVLYEHLLAQAKDRNLRRLYVEASLIAKPFFEHRGFSVVKRHEVQRNGIALVNFLMERSLSPPTGNNIESTP